MSFTRDEKRKSAHKQTDAVKASDRCAYTAGGMKRYGERGRRDERRRSVNSTVGEMPQIINQCQTL